MLGGCPFLFMIFQIVSSRSHSIFPLKEVFMSINNCIHSFQTLSNEILPDHFKRLLETLSHPLTAETLIGFKSATREALLRVSKSKDFSGCYVFLENNKPIYVGISRKVISRLVQHLNYDSHYSASLVYRMAKGACPHNMKRDQAMNDKIFQIAFAEEQKRLQKMSFVTIEIDNDLELYLFEVYASMQLDTGTWNSFRTH